MKKYRIVKLTLKNDKEVYVIQKHTRLFWIGPMIWETYQDVYDGYWCSHIGWTWFTTWGDYFYSLESVQKELDEIKKHDAYTSDYKNKEVICETI